MDNNRNANSSYFNGLVIGVLIGAAAVFLLATKKGKKFVKSVTAEGAEKIEELFEETENIQKPTEDTLKSGQEDDLTLESVVKAGKKFFKRIKN